MTSVNSQQSAISSLYSQWNTGNSLKSLTQFSSEKHDLPARLTSELRNSLENAASPNSSGRAIEYLLADLKKLLNSTPGEAAKHWPADKALPIGTKVALSGADGTVKEFTVDKKGFKLGDLENAHSFNGATAKEWPKDKELPIGTKVAYLDADGTVKEFTVDRKGFKPGDFESSHPSIDAQAEDVVSKLTTYLKADKAGENVEKVLPDLRRAVEDFLTNATSFNTDEILDSLKNAARKPHDGF